jgi:hypothetical protein
MNGPKRQCHSFLPRLTAGELLPDCPVLQKPFMPRQFVAKVAEALSMPKSVAQPG